VFRRIALQLGHDGAHHALDPGAGVVAHDGRNVNEQLPATWLRAGWPYAIDDASAYLARGKIALEKKAGGGRPP
jgi:hypothetical protein